MLSSAATLARMLDAPMPPGRLVWIGLRPDLRAPMVVLDEAAVDAGFGLVGDHHGLPRGPHQVTLIAAESLAAIASYLGRLNVPLALLRRNLAVRGINPTALIDRQFRIGDTILEGSGECQPCSQMEEAFGPGAYNAIRGLGGITARVLQSGTIRVGDLVERIDSDPYNG
jgi:MOSC domain-containing protein YiiM